MVIVASDENQRLTGLRAFKDVKVGERGVVRILLIERESVGNVLDQPKIRTIPFDPNGELPVADMGIKAWRFLIA